MANWQPRAMLGWSREHRRAQAEPPAAARGRAIQARLLCGRRTRAQDPQEPPGCPVLRRHLASGMAAPRQRQTHCDLSLPATKVRGSGNICVLEHLRVIFKNSNTVQKRQKSCFFFVLIWVPTSRSCPLPSLPPLRFSLWKIKRIRIYVDILSCFYTKIGYYTDRFKKQHTTDLEDV